MADTSPGDAHSRTDRALCLFATLGKIGYLRGGPGTYGAAVGVLGYCLAQPFTAPWVLVLVGLLANVAGVPICNAAASRFGEKDPSRVIWDEFASVWLLLACLPSLWTRRAWVLVLGFLLHRLFDIYKPPPVAQLERLPGGWGIMADDCMAALYAWLVLQVLFLVSV